MQELKIGSYQKVTDAKKAGTIKELLNEKADISELENGLKSLENSFSTVAAIKDSVQQEYELITEAKKLDIPVESYRRMFEASQKINVFGIVPLTKLLPQTNNQSNSTDVQPVAEFKTVFSPNGTVEVKRGETFVPEE